MSKRLSRFLSRLSSRKKKSSQPEFISIVGRAHTAAAKSRQPGLKEQQRRISVVNDKGRDYVFGVGDEFSEGSDEISLGSPRGTRSNSSSIYYSAEQEEHSDDNGQKKQKTNADAATLIQAQV